MLTLTALQLNAWIAGLIWPLTRILGLVAAAPVFGNTSVPVSIKVSLGVLLALIMAPLLPSLPAVEPFSWGGLLIMVQELLVGLAMGFTMRLAFAAIEFAGEVGSSTMGLSFASFFDPTTHGRSSGISQFLALLATLAFLAANVHLVLLQALAESFITLPISATPLSLGAPLEMARWGGKVFSVGLQLALPIIAALLVTNLALGILTRAAPQLNLFGIGFPITLGVGLLVLNLLLPYLAAPMLNLFNQGIEASRALPRSGAAKPPVKPPTAPAAPVS
jgi:flagellar biosynthetic protein FliR